MGITAPEAILGSSVFSGLMGANASQNAASTQAAAATQASQNALAATQNSNQLQYSMLQQGLQNSSPYMQGGQEAYSALMGAMGLGAPTAQTGNMAGGTPATTYTNAAGQTVNATGGTTANPYSTQNYGASQGQLNSANGLYSGALTQQFTPSSLNLSPAYQFQLQQGQQALNAAGAATGMLQTGQGIKNVENYTQNQANTAYQSAFNNFQTNQNNLYNRLSGLVTPGANATQGANSAMQSTGANMANTTMSGTSAANNYLTGAAAANAAGTMGTANALSGAATNGVNSWMGNQMMTNYLNGNNGVSAATPYNTVNMTGFQNTQTPLTYGNYGTTPSTGSLTGDY